MKYFSPSLYSSTFSFQTLYFIWSFLILHYIDQLFLLCITFYMAMQYGMCFSVELIFLFFCSSNQVLHLMKCQLLAFYVTCCMQSITYTVKEKFIETLKVSFPLLFLCFTIAFCPLTCNLIIWTLHLFVYI